MSKSRYNNPKRLTNSCNKGLKLEWEEILLKHKHEWKNCVSAKFKIPKVCIEKQCNQSDLNPSGPQVSVKSGSLASPLSNQKSKAKQVVPLARILNASKAAQFMFNSVEVAMERGYAVSSDEIRHACQDLENSSKIFFKELC